VVINNLLDGIFYARLICIKDGEIIEVDSRTSDAHAMAVRFDCPIYTYEFILDAAGVVLEDEGDEDMGEPAEADVPEKKASLSSYSVEDLRKMLDEVLSEENYERAAEIRDEIDRRQQES
jgi:bifunctional DNase/RNase